MTVQEKNIEIAKMLGWKYVSSIDVKDKIYHQSIKAGWYSRLPKALHYKINGLLYKGRSHNDLKFHSDANWQFEAIEYIENLGYIFDIGKNCANIFQDKYPNKEIVNSNKNNRKEAIFEALFQFSQYIKNK